MSKLQGFCVFCHGEVHEGKCDDCGYIYPALLPKQEKERPSAVTRIYDEGGECGG